MLHECMHVLHLFLYRKLCMFLAINHCTCCASISPNWHEMFFNFIFKIYDEKFPNSNVRFQRKKVQCPKLTTSYLSLMKMRFHFWVFSRDLHSFYFIFCTQKSMNELNWMLEIPFLHEKRKIPSIFFIMKLMENENLWRFRLNTHWIFW
jgi:hypothetical protein